MINKTMLRSGALPRSQRAKELAIIAKNLQNTEKVLALEALAETGGKAEAYSETVNTFETAEMFAPYPLKRSFMRVLRQLSLGPL